MCKSTWPLAEVKRMKDFSYFRLKNPGMSNLDVARALRLFSSPFGGGTPFLTNGISAGARASQDTISIHPVFLTKSMHKRLKKISERLEA